MSTKNTKHVFKLIECDSCDHRFREDELEYDEVKMQFLCQTCHATRPKKHETNSEDNENDNQ